jgi:hypothetical protein
MMSTITEWLPVIFASLLTQLLCYRHLSIISMTATISISSVLCYLATSPKASTSLMVQHQIWCITYALAGNYWCIGWIYNHRLPCMISLLATNLSLILRVIVSIASDRDIDDMIASNGTNNEANGDSSDSNNGGWIVAILSWLYPTLQRLVVLLLLTDYIPLIATHPILASLSPTNVSTSTTTSSTSSSSAGPAAATTSSPLSPSSLARASSNVAVDGGFLDELFKDVNVLRISLQSRVPMISRLLYAILAIVYLLKSITQRPFVRQWYCRPFAICIWSITLVFIIVIIMTLTGNNKNVIANNLQNLSSISQMLCLTMGVMMSDVWRNERWYKPNGQYSSAATRSGPTRGTPYVYHAH